MSEATKSRRQLTILAVVAGALLVAIIGIFAVRFLAPTEPRSVEPVAQVPEAEPQGQMPPGMNQAPEVEFDPTTAPVVPDGQTPEEYVREYLELCSAGEFEQAYTMLPIATQLRYGTAASFAETLESYNISGFDVSPQQESGDQITVVGTQRAQGISFPHTWTFVRGGDGSWLVKSRQMGSAVQ
ncbi:MAG: hypothetical protein M1617_06850 [Actinobacteria bacterium]|nr:hypothetical protein [Actinomycetota bacterium]